MSTFNWSNFETEFISSIVYNHKTPSNLKPPEVINDKDMLIPTMDRIAPYPTKEFIVNYREEIESQLLIRYPEVIEKIYKDVSGYRAVNYRGMLNELSKMKLGATLIGRYITAISHIGNPDYSYETTSLFIQTVTIDLSRSFENNLKLYDFQEDAIERLKESLIIADNPSGMLVMPTGSGKTMTTTHFLLKEMISKGYQVIWLTHRHMLIDQTASSFYDYAPLAKHGNPKRKRLQITCVSGEHASIRSTDKSDDVMIISVQSGFRNLDYLKTVLSKKVIIVVDEAHHTVAMSYRRIINYIRKRRTNAKLLGLTATPIRGIDMESRYLHKLFDDNVIYDISMGDLIKKQILANPIFEKIETNSNFEPFISIDEVELIKKFGELPATLVDKIAHSSARNKIIVDTYMKDKERYGKTLIFALNAFHCYTLSQEFRKRGIRCDYIYSGNRNNEEKIRRFKESKNENGLDVLININILTEGSDVPDIQSIFLTRPTQSEGLLVQMVGRGLRGKFAGGTEDAIIVDFCDKWDVFNKWLNPEWLFPAETIKQPEPSGKYLKPTTIPWKVIGEIYKRMRFEGDQSIFRSLKLPIGWYPLLNDDGEDYTMLVWEDQEDNFSNIIKDKDIIINKDNVTSRYIINKYFGGFNMLPNKRDINIFMANLKDGNTLPEMFRFEDRNTIDPIQIVNKIFENNIGIADILTEVEKIYEENIDIIQDVYIDFESYYSRIMENLQNRSNNISTSEIVEIPVELLPYKIEPTHNLEELKQEVIDEMFKGEYLGIESLEWTDKAYTGYYGMYYPDGDIRINKMLDSPDVDREVIKFLVYHEMLHRDYKKHDKNFRREEHKYPNYTEHNRFLDHKIYNYKMQM